MKSATIRSIAYEEDSSRRYLYNSLERTNTEREKRDIMLG